MPRWFVGSYVSVGPSENITTNIFTAQKSEDINNIVLVTGTAAAGATPTLCRVGVWEWDDDLNQGTLVASSTNDTALFATTHTSYTVPLTTTWAKKAGTRYAVSNLVVSTAAIPNFIGYQRAAAGTVGVILGLAPETQVRVGSLSDLPSTLVSAGIGGNTAVAYYRMIP